MSGRAENIVKMRSDDRILVLKPRDDKPLTTTGLVDRRLFSGENKLHAKLDKHHHLWYLQMDAGLLAEPLKQKWTSFQKLLEFVTGYFDRRNIDVTEVID
jgi:hypothetical protein